ncbi:MAG: transporter substrate-binding domain-containing protein [Oscillospiraceae bacterium]|nr:transporter substrate-binding domain-containing protein [Oscillospiraceae bacterium]
MKKIIALILAAITAVAVLAGCGSTNTASSDSTSAQSTEGDWNYIKDKGELVIGITYFEPMNYKDENGELTGFETEFAQKVC